MHPLQVKAALWSLVVAVMLANGYLFYAFSRDNLPHTTWLYLLLSLFVLAYMSFIMYLCVQSKWDRMRARVVVWRNQTLRSLYGAEI